MALSNVIIGWFPLPVLLLLAVVIVYRRLDREFPLFFACVCASFADQIVTLSALRIWQLNRELYFNIFWLSYLLVTAFSLLAIYELFVKRLFRAFYRVRLYLYVFSGLAAFILTISVLSLRHDIAHSTLEKIIHMIDLARVAILIFFIALMLLMGRRWGRYEFGIALGFSVDAAAILSALAIFSRHIPPAARKAFVYAPPVAYDVTCLIWLVCFLWPGEKQIITADEPLDPAILEEAKKSEDALKKKWIGKKSLPER